MLEANAEGNGNRQRRQSSRIAAHANGWEAARGWVRQAAYLLLKRRLICLNAGDEHVRCHVG
jgi:hypothetical protein